MSPLIIIVVIWFTMINLCESYASCKADDLQGTEPVLFNGQCRTCLLDSDCRWWVSTDFKKGSCTNKGGLADARKDPGIGDYAEVRSHCRKGTLSSGGKVTCDDIVDLATRLVDTIDEMSVYALCGTKTPFLTTLMDLDPTPNKEYIHRAKLEVCKKFSDLTSLSTEIIALQVMCQEAKTIKPPQSFSAWNFATSLGMAALKAVPFGGSALEIIKASVKVYEVIKQIKDKPDTDVDAKAIVEIFQRVLDALKEGMKLAEGCALLNAGGKAGDVRRKVAFMSNKERAKLKENHRKSFMTFLKVSTCHAIFLADSGFKEIDSKAMDTNCPPFKKDDSISLNALGIIDYLGLRKLTAKDNVEKPDTKKPKSLKDCMISNTKDLIEKIKKEDFSWIDATLKDIQLCIDLIDPDTGDQSKEKKL